MAKSNLKEFWRHANARHREDSFPGTTNFNDKLTENAKDIVELFAQQFRSIYKMPGRGLSSVQINFECMQELKEIDREYNDVVNVCEGRVSVGSIFASN